MKLYSKKINRGIVLGGACLIFLIIYLIAEQIAFSNEKAQIRSVIENYITELEHLNESAVSLNEALPILETYWTTGSTKLSCSWTDMAMALHGFFSSNRCKIIHTGSTIGQYQITQNGTNRAMVNGIYSFTADIQKTGLYLLLCDTVSLSDTASDNSATSYRLSGTVQITADMTYEKQKWMIAGIDISVLEQNMQPVTE